MTVTIGTPVAGTVPGTTVQTLCELTHWDARHGGRRLHPDRPFVFVHGGTVVANARNDLVYQFLALPERPDWLLMLDDDQHYPPHLLEHLFTVADPQAHPIVGVPVWRYAMPDHRVTHNAFDVLPHGEFVEYPDLPVGEHKAVPVAAIGTGCLLVHRDVLEAMRAKARAAGGGEHWCWFRHVVYPPDHAEGEDLYFCRLAHACGYSILCLTALVLEHVKPSVLSGPRPGTVEVSDARSA